MTNNYIPSIYNYCDRWCERCSFTNRCMSYSSRIEWEEKHPDKKDDWAAQLSYHFKKAIEMLHEAALQEGIDLNNIEPIEEKINEEIEVQKEKAINLAKVYEGFAEDWLKAKKTIFEKRQDEIVQQYEIGIKEVANDASDINNALEIIQWYFFFIRAKVSRAFSGLNDEDYLKAYPIQNDMNGSAKIAIVAIDNSLAAWEMLRQHFPDETDNILDNMLALSNMKKNILLHFPKVMEFIRPGFDEF